MLSIKNTSRADSQVSWPAANTKVVQNLAQNLKKNAVSHTTFAGRPTKLARHTVHTSFILDPIIFGTHNLTMPIINKIKKFFK